ncbi:FAD-dependent oxidoreductase [Thermodesulfobacteriota bacterium]
MAIENLIETDVLVIGGGLAGCFAAIKAKEQGADVVLVDKGYVGKTGGSPYAAQTMVFNPEWGHDFDALMEQVNVLGEYVNNRLWNEIVFRESHDRFKDLQSYGVKFIEENGKVAQFPSPITELDFPDRDKFPPLVCQVVKWLPGWPETLRKKVKEFGVVLMERIMIHELIKQDEGIAGAVGYPVDKEEPVVFNTKAVVIAAGGGGFRPVDYPTHELTADGAALAYRVGATVTGKEFVSPNLPGELEPHPGWKPAVFKYGRTGPTPPEGERPMPPGEKSRKPMISFLAPMFNAEGDEVPHRGMSWHGYIDVHHEVHAGRGPVWIEGPGGSKINFNGPGAAGSLHGHSCAGIFPADTDCSVGIPGLYAAGDSLGTQFVGATYSGFGFATAYATVTGTRAGKAAAEFAEKAGDITVENNNVEAIKKSIREPLERKGGFSPRWITEILRSYMKPYFVMYIKHEDRLKAALMNVEFIRDHLVPKMVAKDAHELRLVHETRSMVLNAEMKLRSSMFRKESRGNHYREDYPKRNDPEWLAWILLKDEGGKMTLSKKMMPEEWWPDSSKSYEERYPLEFPTS